MNEVIGQFLLIVGSTHDKTMPSSNDAIKKLTVIYVHSLLINQEHIPFIMRILNTNVNERTNCTTHVW